jgi:predicted aspartyl protease/Tfp pilus assembly protein PilF
MFRSFLSILLLAFSATAVPFAQVTSDESKAAMQAPPLSASDPLTEAGQLFRTGKLDNAREKYEQVIHEAPKSADGYAGLTRVYLKQKNLQQAYETISTGLEVADSAPVRVALGEVYFRQGKIQEAEREWVNVINSGNASARAYLGLARVTASVSMYKRSRTMISKAHELDPHDPDVQKYWMNTLKLPERIKYLEDYLSHETNDDAETRARMQRSLDYMKARSREPKRKCRLVSKTISTETNLVRLLRDANHLRGFGLAVTVNGERSKLLLDTGAGGILIDRRLAERAGLNELSQTRIGGIGDKGETGGYVALANSIKIGDLEFQDCAVTVLDKRSVMDEDGLIGADVFEDFLVDIDFPNEKLRLLALPKRPDDEPTRPIGLQTDKDNPDSPEEQSDNKTAPAAPAKPLDTGPRDRFIAPEMKSYSQVLRFGHMLLIPTKVGDEPRKLFLIDTGAFSTHISLNAAREVTKVHDDPRLRVKGLSGSVKNVYTADKAVLQFGNLRQPTEDLITLDLNSMSDRVGIEVSGILGFATLHVLDIKIDYRDGLVDFIYKPPPGH